MKNLRVSTDPDSAPWEELCENTSGGKPLQATRFRVWRDDKRLKIAFEVIDDSIHATQTLRDGPLWNEEVVELFLDPVGDLEAYYEIEVNPLGTVTDLMLRRTRNGWRKDFAWDCEGLEAAVSRNASGWMCDLSFPFESVGAIPSENTEWRANFFRIDRPARGDRELSAWVPTLCSTFHVPERFGVLRFG